MKKRPPRSLMIIALVVIGGGFLLYQVIPMVINLLTILAIGLGLLMLFRFIKKKA